MTTAWLHPRRPGLATAMTSLAPTAVFLIVDQLLGLVPAMVAASALTVALVVIRRRRGQGVGLLLPLTLAFVVVKAVAGVLTQSPVVYFGAGLVLSALVALAVGATAFTRRPVATQLIPLVAPYRLLTPAQPVYRRVSAHVTAAWALGELAMTAWEASHLLHATGSEFLLARSVVAWPAMGVLIFVLIAYVRFRLDRYEHALRRAERSATGRPEGPGDEHRLEEEAHQTLAVGVEPEPAPALRPLLEVAGEDGDEEAGEKAADGAPRTGERDERGTQHHLRDTRRDDHRILVE